MEKTFIEKFPGNNFIIHIVNEKKNANVQMGSNWPNFSTSRVKVAVEVGKV